MSDAFAILPPNMGKEPKGGKDPRQDPHKFIPEQRGGLLLKDPKEEQCPYTFKDSPAYVAKKKFDEQIARATELESKDETRGFLRSVEELGKKHKWDEAFQVLERRTAVPSGLFLVTRAVLRWKFAKYSDALADVDEALKNYSSSAKAGPLAAAFSCFLRICLGSPTRDQGSCSKEMQPLVADWDETEQQVLRRSALGYGLFHPRLVDRLTEPSEVLDGYEATDGVYVAAPGVKIGYTLLKNTRELVSAPVVIHFHGSNETAADYRAPDLAEKYRSLGVHLLVVDYRGYGWSTDEAPSLATFLRDAEPFADGLGELLVKHGFSWPYPGGLILSGRSLGAQVAVHLATVFPALFRFLMLDSALATSATGDRLGKATERSAALERWKKELEKASLDALQPLSSELWVLSVHEKIRAFDGALLVLHGLADETVPFEGSESLHAAACSKQKELVLVEDADHNTIGHYEAYWSAQKRFILKAQLSDATSAANAKVQHLCAVCAEKAVSKCGRCQKVWYCSRKCQAEHWKTHKATCAGGPPEPKPKAEAESEACLAGVVTANVLSDDDLASLRSCLSSISNQTEPLHSIHLSWFAESEALAEQVKGLLTSLPTVAALQTTKPSTRFEHIAGLSGQLSSSAPAHAWVAFASLNEVWNPRCSSLLLPSLRKAAADQRILAACCKSRAHSPDIQTRPCDSSEVDTLLASKSLELLVGDAHIDPHIADYVVKIKTLLTFVESTAVGMIHHDLCTHRFLYKLQHTFGKKVQAVQLADDDKPWLRWVAALHPDPETGMFVVGEVLNEQEGSSSSSSRLPRPSDDDRRRGEHIFENLKSLDRFANADAASLLMTIFRLSILRRMAQWSGEKVTAKDMKTMTTDLTTTFLEESNLSEVLGMQRWVRDVAFEIADGAAKLFSVNVTSA